MKTHRLYEFGVFRVDADERILLRDSEVVKLAPKAFDLLLALIEKRNRIISKDELMSEVWADSFVEEANLTVHVSALRKIFNGENYIETVPRRGYRFNAEVREINDENANGNFIKPAAAFSDETTARENFENIDAKPEKSDFAGETSADSQSKSDSFPANNPPTASPNKTKTIFALAAILLIIFASGYFWNRRNRKPALAAQKITRIPGMEKSVAIAISPDGQYLAHAVSAAGKRSLQLLHINSRSSVQLVAPADVLYLGLTFSNDSSYVYYSQTAKDGSSILYKIPILGGDAKKILENVPGEISFSPDGTQFAFIRRNGEKESLLMIADSENGGGERVVSRKNAPEFFSIYELSWSPDGKTVACAKGETNKKNSLRIVAVNVETGEEIPFSDKNWSGADGLAWLSDGSGIVAAVFEPATAPTQIWILPYPSGKPYQITNDLNNYGSIGLTADSKILLAGQFETTSGIWLISNINSSPPKAVKQGKHHHFNFLSWTGDNRILYASSASSNRDIWTINADGSNQKQLTADAGENIQPVASPDNRYIVFSSDRATVGVQNIWRMDADGANPVRLTGGGGEFQPVVTPDGKWVIYTSEAATDAKNSPRTLWKIPIDGGEPLQLISNPSQWADIAPDGKTFACWYKTDEKSPWKIAVFPIEGGEPLKILDITPVSPVHWTPDAQAISFVKTVEGVSNIWSQPLNGGEPKQITDFTTEQILNFDWSNDNQLICSRSITNRDTLLISNFR